MVKKEITKKSQLPADPEADIPSSLNPEKSETQEIPGNKLELEPSESLEDKKGSEKRHVRKDILRWLIVRDTCSVSKITALCDLNDKGKNKYSYIWRQMSYLKDKGYIEKKIHFGINDPHQGQGPCYSIVKNLRVISEIYYDPEFKELQRDIRTNSDWISELILDERFNFLTSITRRHVKGMLTKSVIFFELSLEYQISNHLLLLMKRLFFEPMITSLETGEFNESLKQFYITRIAVYDLFVYCMFREDFEKMVNHEMPKEDQDFLDNMLRIRILLKKEVKDYHESIKISEILFALLKTYNYNNYEIPEELKMDIIYHSASVTRSQKEGFLNVAVRSKSIKDFQKIMEDLKISPEKSILLSQ
jgi:hypothetical protein